MQKYHKILNFEFLKKYLIEVVLYGIRDKNAQHLSLKMCTNLFIHAF